MQSVGSKKKTGRAVCYSKANMVKKYIKRSIVPSMRCPVCTSVIRVYSTKHAKREFIPQSGLAFLPVILYSAPTQGQSLVCLIEFAHKGCCYLGELQALRDYAHWKEC